MVNKMVDQARSNSCLKITSISEKNVPTLFHSPAQLTEGIGLQSGQEITESRFVAELQQQIGHIS
jgi:hypothetical protein